MIYRSSVWSKFLKILSSSVNTGSKYPRGSDSYSIHRSSILFLARWLVGGDFRDQEMNMWWIRWLNDVLMIVVILFSEVASLPRRRWRANEKWLRICSLFHKCSARQVRGNLTLRLPIPSFFPFFLPSSLPFTPASKLFSFVPFPQRCFLLFPSLDTPLTWNSHRKCSKSVSLDSSTNRSWSGARVNGRRKNGGRKKKRGKCLQMKNQEWMYVITISWTIHTPGHCLVSSPSPLTSHLCP